MSCRSQDGGCDRTACGIFETPWHTYGPIVTDNTHSEHEVVPGCSLMVQRCRIVSSAEKPCAELWRYHDSFSCDATGAAATRCRPLCARLRVAECTGLQMHIPQTQACKELRRLLHVECGYRLHTLIRTEL